MSDEIAGTFNAQDDVTRVTLKGFVPGTQVKYKISSDKKVLAQEQALVDESGILSLPIKNEAFKKSSSPVKKIRYELDVEKTKQEDQGKEQSISASNNKQTPKDILRIMLALDPRDGSIDVSTSGLEDFSDITLKQSNGEEQTLSADWAGRFAASLGQQIGNSQADSQLIELAFQNTGIHSDLSSFNMGKPTVEAFTALTARLYGDEDGPGYGDIESRWGVTLIKMTSQFSRLMTFQTFNIGLFFDATIQLQTQRKIQELMARAHKDYHPSDQMCRIGTYMRSIAHTDIESELEKMAVNKYLLEQYTGVEHTAASGGSEVYEGAKVDEYVENYCEGADNGGAVSAICENTAVTDPEELRRKNIDIDYTRALETKLTLDVKFADGVRTNDEEDILALARHLYVPTAFNTPKEDALKEDIRPHYESRSYAAKMAVAHNSFVSIVGMKSAASEREDPLVEENAGWVFMKSMLTNELGFDDDEAHEMMGERPSYYAQMEILTKKIYQNPKFYINLYDKPANVKRLGATLDAISLMNMRDRYQSLLRREMLSAVLIESTLQEKVSEINSNMLTEMQKTQLGR
ncbi:MAG: hypothetical protein ACLFP8_03075 [Alphaproteobacteria bacterium]